ncbi:MAG: hypothetical protein PHP85_09325 [Gallionella sp.]|nr:hypothetical protein [Gallionella sp.]
MADGMKIIGKREEGRGKRAQLFAVFSLLFTVCSWAEELVDPTLPPASVSVPAAVSGVANPPAGLQSILISRQRRAAIIDGELVALGGKHGDATLIEVNEESVVLRNGQGRQVLSLFPDVIKRSKSVAALKPAANVRVARHKRPKPGEKK